MSERVTLLEGDCLMWMDTLEPDSVESCLTDPPYHLTSIVKRFGSGSPPKGEGAAQRLSRGFMGKQWDGGDIAFRAETWAKVHRVLKPGAYLCAFSATRTYHRMVSAIEDAGFIILDQLDWLYGSGFPKSVNIAHMMEKTLCRRDGRDWVYEGDGALMRREPPYRNTEADRWHGYGTALKPAHEPIVLAQKPISERTIIANVKRWGTGALNIAGCRIDVAEPGGRPARSATGEGREDANAANINVGSGMAIGETTEGRWPANVLHDGSEDVEREFSAFAAPGAQSPVTGNEPTADGFSGPVKFGGMLGRIGNSLPRGDCGSPSRFFYSAKAQDSDRLGSDHPTVKPIDLMAWLVRLTTPAGGVVLDPFSGSGTTAQAALREGRRAIAIEREAEYCADIRRRIAHVEGADTPLFGDTSPDTQAA